MLGELTLSWLQLSSREATVLTAHAREVEQTGPLPWLPWLAGAGGAGREGPIDHTTPLAGRAGGSRSGQSLGRPGELTTNTRLGRWDHNSQEIPPVLLSCVMLNFK